MTAIAPFLQDQDEPAGFLDFVDSRKGCEAQDRLPVFEHRILKIGRDPRSNNFAIATDCSTHVSRNHCEFYVVVYEPLVNHVYVRDRKSYNGTFVNDESIGAAPQITSGYLLEDGDVIEIRPHWKFTFHQTPHSIRHELTSLQREECKVFEDKYKLTNHCLGQGAEAAVYLTVDARTRKQLVCKLVNLDKMHGRNVRERLRRTFQEADILRQLQHPNILPYVDAIASSHTLYLFTELASGGDLMSFLYRHNFVPEFDTRIILRQVVTGLRYLHKKGIVHRDLKPENILLAYSPKIAYHRIMLSDFGTSAVPHRSRMITNVGTSSYQAPEFQTRSQSQTTAVDMWSLGMVALLLLTTTGNGDISGLSRVDQQDLNECVEQKFSGCAIQPSVNGRKFISECLSLTPENRMDALQAECHDWLQTPDKHLEFFQRLDRRMMNDYRLHSQLRPIPYQLPNVDMTSGGELEAHSPKESETISQYFAEAVSTGDVSLIEKTHHHDEPVSPQEHSQDKKAVSKERTTSADSKQDQHDLEVAPRLSPKRTSKQEAMP